MKKLMIAALHSGAGKTAVTCALLAALKERGLNVCAFKCGPDYIDPMFHTKVLGLESRSLDLFLQGADGVRETLRRARGDVAVLEAAMGFYDGVGGTDEASAWAVAETLNCPVVLVLRPGGAALTLAAQLKGVLAFRANSRIAGFLLNDCKPSLAAHLTPILERETGLPVLGFLSHRAEADFPSRHLGLLTADEIDGFTARCEALGAALKASVDLDRLLTLAAEENTPRAPRAPAPPAPRCRVAVARDEAFCFYYADSLDALRAAGAGLCFFSPLRDGALPENIGGIYLGGGYPELHAKRLSENAAMRADIARAVRCGMPTVAECGGFLYLQSSLQDGQKRTWPMAGVFRGEGYPTGALRRFGYLTLHAESDSLLFRRGEICPAHEFHHWDTDADGEAFLAKKPHSARQWRCGFAHKALYAAFPHLHLGGTLPLARRFADAAERYQKGRSGE